jgi:hypothetical protein
MMMIMMKLLLSISHVKMELVSNICQMPVYPSSGGDVINDVAISVFTVCIELTVITVHGALLWTLGHASCH